MKNEELFEAIGDIDEKFLHEYEKTRFFNIRKRIVEIGSLAAAVLLSVGVWKMYFSTDSPTVPMPSHVGSSLKNQKLSLIEGYEPRAEGGFYDTVEEPDLEHAIKYYDNLLDKGVKKYYPVYKGYGSYDDMLLGKSKKNISVSEMDQLARHYADCQGTSIEKTKKENYESKLISKNYICKDKTEIMVEKTGDFTIQLSDMVKRPKKSVLKGKDIYEKSIAFYQYYFEKYKKFFDFSQAKFFIDAQDPNVRAKFGVLQMYFQDADVSEKTKQYYTISITPGMEGMGDCISFASMDVKGAKCIGKYPIISKEEATKKLLAGEGKTLDALFDKVTENRISGVTLSYMGTTPQPVYTFYLRLTEKEKKVAYENAEAVPKDTVYIKYYVPAVESKYLKKETSKN